MLSRLGRKWLWRSVKPCPGRSGIKTSKSFERIEASLRQEWVEAAVPWISSSLGPCPRR
jgi:hypothetical protein